MNNEPFFTNNLEPTNPLTSAPNNFRAPRKAPNPKIFGIGAGIVAVLIIAGLIVLLPKETPVRAGEFNENASSNRSVETARTYISLNNFELIDPILTPYESDEIEDKIIKFFTYAFPDISELTVKNKKIEESSIPAEISDEENPASSKSYLYSLKSNNGKSFSVEVYLTSNLSTYNLTIKDSTGSEIYNYNAGEITKDLYDRSGESLLDSIFSELPLSSETADGEKFDITFEGDDKDRLTLSATSESETLINCDAAKTAAVKFLSGFKSVNEISEENFVCE